MSKIVLVALAMAFAAGGALAAEKPQARVQPRAVKMSESQMARATAGYYVVNRGEGVVWDSNPSYRGAVALCNHGRGSSASSTLCYN